MKYQTVAKLVKASRILRICEHRGIQWIGTVCAMYPVYNMPRMSAAEIITFLGLEKEADDITVSETEILHIDFDDAVGNELLIEDYGVDIEGYRTFYTDSGAVLVNNDFVKPVTTHADGAEMVFFLRRT